MATEILRPIKFGTACSYGGSSCENSVTLTPEEYDEKHPETCINEEESDNDATYLTCSVDATLYFTSSVFFDSSMLRQNYEHISNLVCTLVVRADTTVFSQIGIDNVIFDAVTTDISGAPTVYVESNSSTAIWKSITSSNWEMMQFSCDISTAIDTVRSNLNINSNLPPLVFAISSKPKSGAGKNPTMDITQAYVEITYDNDETETVYLKENGIWSPIPCVIYQKQNGIWKTIDSTIFDNGNNYKVQQI